MGDNAVAVNVEHELFYNLYRLKPVEIYNQIQKLEDKLTSLIVEERLDAVSLLANIFTDDKSSDLARYRSLWQKFLARFDDSNPIILAKCVECSLKLLSKQPDYRKDIMEALKRREHDIQESVRLEFIKCISLAITDDFSVIIANDELLGLINIRARDTKGAYIFYIRQEALLILGNLYRAIWTIEDVPPCFRKSSNKIKDRILRSYYLPDINDRISVERILKTRLVPFKLDSYNRMLMLLHLYGTIDEESAKAFNETQKAGVQIRRCVSDYIKLLKLSNTQHPNYSSLLGKTIGDLSKFLPNEFTGVGYLQNFGTKLKAEQSLLQDLEILVDSEVSCEVSVEKVGNILQNLDSAANSLYYKAIKVLLERMSSVLIDKQAVEKLLSIIDKVLNHDEEILDKLDLVNSTALHRGFRLIQVLAAYYPAQFLDESILLKLIEYFGLKSVGDEIPFILNTLFFIGKGTGPLGQRYPNCVDSLAVRCQHFMLNGNPKQGKAAVCCFHMNIKDEERRSGFAKVLGETIKNLDPHHQNCRTSLVVFGYIAELMPEEFSNDLLVAIKTVLTNKFFCNVKLTENIEETQTWRDFEDLPEITRLMLTAMKAIARWIIGVKEKVRLLARKVFRLMISGIETSGACYHIKESSSTFSSAEQSWLRMTAGCSLLKACVKKEVTEGYVQVDFFSIARLMIDDVFEVRCRFAEKLNKGLTKGFPFKCLPIDFTGLFALGGYEQDRKLRSVIQSYVFKFVKQRRDYAKSFLASGRDQNKIMHIYPDYMLVYSIIVLANEGKKFTDYKDKDQLNQIKECVWFVLEPLLKNNEYSSVGFYRALVQKIKNRRNNLNPYDEKLNCNMFAVCDVALGLLFHQYQNLDIKQYPFPMALPNFFFAMAEDPKWTNTQVYVPLDLQYSVRKKRPAALPAGSGSRRVNGPKRTKKEKTLKK